MPFVPPPPMSFERFCELEDQGIDAFAVGMEELERARRWSNPFSFIRSLFSPYRMKYGYDAKEARKHVR